MKARGHPSKEESFFPVSRGGSIKASSRVGIKRHNLIQVIPTTNKFEVLANLNDISEASSASSEGHITSRNFKKKNQKKTQGLNNSGTRRQRIILIGDSHVRNCATDLQHNLGGNYEVTGFAKPGAIMEEIVNTVRKDVQTLSNKDVVIVWGGSNDISKNNTKVAINQLSKFVEEKKNVNLVLMKAPHRHDLMPSSCVNNEVLKFNRQMEKKMKTYHNVKLFDTELDRKYFATHGQHLNASSKELISNKLSIVIKDLFAKKQPTQICMPWKERSQVTDLNPNNPDELLLESTDTISDTLDQQNDSVNTRISNRRKKFPPTRNEDFLWE
jgi:RNase H-fold protein (predicted Holliday junction resolvase)